MAKKKTESKKEEKAPIATVEQLEAAKHEARKGTHIADGVMWCPKCGGEQVSMGHVDCHACEPDKHMSREEFMAIHDKNVEDGKKRTAFEEDQKAIAAEHKEEYDPEYLYEREDNSKDVPDPEDEESDEEE